VAAGGEEMMESPKKERHRSIRANDEKNIAGYEVVLAEVVNLLESARRTSARSINAVITATYWNIGWRIVEFEQGGKLRAEYGKELLKRLSLDLTVKFGRSFSVRNLEQMRLFYMG
jgi:hypothetical protein